MNINLKYVIKRFNNGKLTFNILVSAAKTISNLVFKTFNFICKIKVHCWLSLVRSLSLCYAHIALKHNVFFLFLPHFIFLFIFIFFNFFLPKIIALCFAFLADAKMLALLGIFTIYEINTTKYDIKVVITKKSIHFLFLLKFIWTLLFNILHFLCQCIIEELSLRRFSLACFCYTCCLSISMQFSWPQRRATVFVK